MTQTAMSAIETFQASLRASTMLLMALMLTIGAAGGPVELALLERDAVERAAGEVDAGPVAQDTAGPLVRQRRVVVGDQGLPVVGRVVRDGDRDPRDPREDVQPRVVEARLVGTRVEGDRLDAVGVRGAHDRHDRVGALRAPRDPALRQPEGERPALALARQA